MTNLSEIGLNSSTTKKTYSRTLIVIKGITNVIITYCKKLSININSIKLY